MSGAEPKTIGPYTVTREIGRGGMGVVYLARDTRLDRDVAIKALPEHLESDPDRLARFQREARALASMNHPNIGAIHGLEVDGGRHYLVLEFVEGGTLDARLARGPMDIGEAIEIAIQIASALEAAHDKGIVHRDLKPANVMLTPDGTAKVLDFGLARTPDVTGSSTDVTVAPDSPTLTSPMPVHSPTIPGAIMGTAGYMSPEQARGRTIDKRSDIFSFGCVLYEMLTGLRPFSGETVADVLGATLHKELDLGLLPPQTPANVRRVLKRCLAKDKRQRLHDIADVRLELSEPDTFDASPAPAPAATSSRRDRLLQILVPILIVVAAWAWINRPTTQQPQQQDTALPVVRFELEFQGDIDPAMISPDGTKIVYTVDRTDSWVRTLGQSQPRRLDIPSGSMPLGWGDDSDTLYYAVFEGYELKTLWRFDFSRGNRRFLAEFPEEGFAWGGSHMITEVDESRLVFSVASAGLFEVDREGGTPVRILEPEREQFFITPIALPGTEAILFSNATEGKVELLESGERTTVLERPGRTIGSVTYAHPGYIFFEVYGSDSLAGVWAAPFLISQRAVTGSATRLFGRGTVTFSRDGHLVFLDETRSQDYPRELVWVDPEQQKAELAFDQALIGLDWPALNPDGQRVAVSVRLSEAEMPRDLNILNLATGARFQLADNRGSDFDPAWRADGETLLFSTWNAGIRELRERRADGSDVARVLDDAVIRFSISAEDKYLLVGIDSLDYYESGDDTRKVFTDDAGPQFSLHPTTKFIAYEPANGQGIILRPFPSGEGLAMVIGERVQASKFNPEGTALYCWRGEDLVAIPIDVTGSQPVVGSPRVLLRASDYGLLPGSAFDFGPDGRLLMIRATQEELRQTDSSVITVIQNWPEALDLAVEAAER